MLILKSQVFKKVIQERLSSSGFNGANAPIVLLLGKRIKQIDEI